MYSPRKTKEIQTVTHVWAAMDLSGSPRDRVYQWEPDIVWNTQEPNQYKPDFVWDTQSMWFDLVLFKIGQTNANQTLSGTLQDGPNQYKTNFVWNTVGLQFSLVLSGTIQTNPKQTLSGTLCGYGLFWFSPGQPKLTRTRLCLETSGTLYQSLPVLCKVKSDDYMDRDKKKTSV
uniref:Uncharacterized protein n=1 Tax=Timema douglasi TaxID=61478 RepID=A0A7R8VDG9_TIMDO|nr:unnamed protein product [Timema douglasi]